MLGIFLAIFASALLNVGKGVQKWKVAVLAQRRYVLAPAHRRDFGWWVLGVAMSLGATITYSYALALTDKPSTVSALNGVGLLVLVGFAAAVLGERVGWREGLGAVLVVGGTGLMGAASEAGAPPAPSLPALVVCAASLFGVFAPLAALSWWSRRGHGLVFGAAAGALIGLAMVLGKVALAQAGNRVAEQFGGPWVYAAMGVGALALTVTQVAFWRATAMVVVPTANSFVIFTPAILELFVFGSTLAPLQWLALAVIIAGVVRLTAGGTPTPAPSPSN